MATTEELEAKRELELCMYPRSYGSRHIMTREDYDWLSARLVSATGAHKDAILRSLDRATVTS